MNKHELKSTNERLEYLGEGAHKCGFFKGWICIGISSEIGGEEAEEYTKVKWCKSKNMYNSYLYKVIGCYRQGRIWFMHHTEKNIIPNKEAQKYYSEFLNDKILKAYVKKFNSVPSRYKLFKGRIKNKLTDKFNNWLVKPDKRIPGVR